MDKNKLSVSAIIPCYNGEKYIGETLKSLINQYRKPDEILVIDDGSVDNTAEIVEKYNVRLIRHSKNMGLASARNTGIRCSKGDILVFIDADTYPDKDFIKTLLNFYTSEKIAGVGGRNIESNIKSVYDLFRKIHMSQYGGLIIEDCAPFVAGACCSYRKEILTKVGGFNTLFTTNAEDCDIGMRINRAGYRIIYTPQAKVHHQRTDNWRSLHNLAYRYSYWKVIICVKNRTTYLLTYSLAFKDMLKNILQDFLTIRNLKLIVLDISIGITNFIAIWQGFKNAKSLGFFDRDAKPKNIF